jgi:hypothetical protein
MKKAIIALAILFAASGTATTALAHGNHGKGKGHKKHAHAAKKYTCPMHPEVVQSKPGKCPKCGMNLELVKAKKK